MPRPGSRSPVHTCDELKIFRRRAATVIVRGFRALCHRTQRPAVNGQRLPYCRLFKTAHTVIERYHQAGLFMVNMKLSGQVEVGLFRGVGADDLDAARAFEVAVNVKVSEVENRFEKAPPAVQPFHLREWESAMRQ